MMVKGFRRCFKGNNHLLKRLHLHLIVLIGNLEEPIKTVYAKNFTSVFCNVQYVSF